MRQILRLRAFAASAALLGCLFSTRQEPAPTQDPARWVVEAGDHQVSSLIDSAARYLGRNLLYSPAELQGAASLQIQRKLDLDPPAAEEVLGQLLYTRGLVLVPRDQLRGLWEVISINGPRRVEISNFRMVLSADEVETWARRKVYVCTRVVLQHVGASQAANSLRPFFAGMGNMSGLTVGSVGDGALLLAGFADDVAAAVRMVRLADVPPAQPDAGLAGRLATIESRLLALERAMVPPGPRGAAGGK